ncbi:hypothetical protein Sango_1915400 [Sesamum angolense]|uniref:RNase H type-1 domain-containing protein n=1 Tax=Sesamum angolense TaxID=2727404 RepID=A0AAE1WDK9_9LAMI|nr:hypothetical protein Sango_1915400 [Sesamum angolense]
MTTITKKEMEKEPQEITSREGLEKGQEAKFFEVGSSEKGKTRRRESGISRLEVDDIYHIHGSAEKDVIRGRKFEPGTNSIGRVGFGGSKVTSLGTIDLATPIGEEPKWRTTMIRFLVVDTPFTSSSASNGGAEILLQGQGGVEIEVAAKLSFPFTNEAEYKALILGLELDVYTNSQLVAMQIGGSYETHEWSMTQYLKKIKEMMAAFTKGETPFCLVHDTKAIIPAEIKEETKRISQYDPASKREGRFFDLTTMEERRDHAYAQRLHHKSLMIRSYKRKVRPRHFQVGDLVLKKQDQAGLIQVYNLGSSKYQSLKQLRRHQSGEYLAAQNRFKIQQLITTISTKGNQIKESFKGKKAQSELIDLLDIMEKYSELEANPERLHILTQIKLQGVHIRAGSYLGTRINGELFREWAVLVGEYNVAGYW